MGINQMDGGYDKFVVGQQPVGPDVEPIPTRPNVSIGQAKYAKRCAGESIYEDETRNTADDNEAEKVADMMPNMSVDDAETESQGI